MINEKNNVWIFGDSFSTEFYTNSLNGNIFTNTWPYMLKNNYNVYNPSLCGVGPHSMINLLLSDGTLPVHFYNDKEDKNYIIKSNYNKKEDITVLFFLSAIERVHFTFLEVLQHQCIMLDLDHDLTKQYEKYRDKINFFRKYYFTEEWAVNNILYIFFTLIYLTKIFKKILFFPIFEREYNIIKNNIFTKNIPENLHIVDWPLSHNTLNHNLGYDVDPNPNHIIQEKHIHMYNFLNEYIKNSTLNYNELNKLKI